MGLDITAHKKLIKAIGNEAFDDAGELKYDEDWFQLYVNPHYQERAKDIDDGKAYKSEDSFGFRPGSYGGYNKWREQLAEMAGYNQSSYEQYGQEFPSYAATLWNNPTSGPFAELIDFSDCEGVIDTIISKKLAKDFAEFQEKADQHHDDYFKKKYSEWRKAFELASDDGCVDFH